MEIASPREIFSICQTCESPRGPSRGSTVGVVGWGPEMAWRAGHLLIPPGIGKSHRML
jgi:hypothetical protein